MMYQVINGGDFPQEAEAILFSLNQRNRLIKQFVVVEWRRVGADASGETIFQLRIYDPDTGTRNWCNPNQSIENQLIEAGVCRQQ